MAFLVIAAGSVGAYAYVKLNNASKEAHVSLARGEQSVKRIKEFDPGKDSFSVLLLGIDAREENGEMSIRQEVMRMCWLHLTGKKKQPKC